MSTEILRLVEENTDAWQPELTVDRRKDGRLEIAVYFGQEGQSIVLTPEQESQLKLALTSR